MKTDLEVEVEVDLRHLGKVIIFRDKQTDRTFLLYIDHHGNHHDDHQNWTGMPSDGSAPPIAGFLTGERAALIQLGCYLLPMCISAANVANIDNLCCY